MNQYETLDGVGCPGGGGVNISTMNLPLSQSFLERSLGSMHFPVGIKITAAPRHLLTKYFTRGLWQEEGVALFRSLQEFCERAVELQFVLQERSTLDECSLKFSS